MYPSISYNDTNFNIKLVEAFTKNGIVVINDIMTPDECDYHVDNIIDDFCKLGSGIDKNNIKNTWIDENLPPYTRPGLFQALVANLESLWKIRSNNKINNIFAILYSHYRKNDITEYIVSGDGINIKPGNIGPFNNNNDWAHLDQTSDDDIYKCIQGQMVLTNTSASFVGSPKSHLYFLQILKQYNKKSTSNWWKFNDNDKKNIKNFIIKNGCSWQIPIKSRKGSFIIWSSTTIHSAKLQDNMELPLKEDKYFGWRCVVYVCYRPKSEFNEKELTKRLNAFEENRVTNHWGTKIFPKVPNYFANNMSKKCDVIKELVNNPKLVYNKLGKPKLSQEQLKLLGI
jgi:hypothetical protein